MKRFLLPAFALALAVNANATSFQANMFAGQQAEAQVTDGSKTFIGDLSVYMANGSEMGTTEKSQILVTKESDGKYTFVLKNFSVSGINVGDATVPSLEGKEENGVITLEATNVEASVAGGDLEEIVRTITMSMKATIKGDYMVADISKVDVTALSIVVSAKFASKIYPSEQIMGTFDGEWEKCIPWDSDNNTTVVGTTPKGWCISNVYTGIANQTMGEQGKDKDDDGKEGNGNNKKIHSVLLTNKLISISGVTEQKIPAYISLGTTWATAKGTSASNADGGTWGGKKFTYRPDALTFDYQRNNENGEENAMAIAYLWKGTWTQENVPGNTTPFGKPKKCTMINRDRNILNEPTSEGGTVTKDDDAALIASFKYQISESTDGDWETITIPFDYKTDDIPENINIIFSANDYFGDRTKIVGGNTLTIDNVKLIYYHTLSDIKLKGKTIDGFDDSKIEYTVKGNMSDYKNALDCTLKSANSTKDVNWNDAENLVTITVKGSNYAEDNESMTVYTIKFEGTGTGIHNVTSTSTNTANGAIYDLSGRQLKTMQKGINIVRGKDGKMIKVMK